MAIAHHAIRPCGHIRERATAAPKAAVACPDGNDKLRGIGGSCRAGAVAMIDGGRGRATTGLRRPSTNKYESPTVSMTRHAAARERLEMSPISARASQIADAAPAALIQLISVSRMLECHGVNARKSQRSTDCKTCNTIDGNGFA